MEDTKKYPLRAHSDPDTPVWQMPISIMVRDECLCWPGAKDPRPKTSSDDLRKAIAQAAGKHVPNQHLASFGVGDVIVATDGLFWITPEWKVELLPAEDEKKAKQVIEQW